MLLSPKRKKGRSISDYRDRTALLLGLMVYDYATWFWNCYAGLTPPFAVVRGSHTRPYKEVIWNTTGSIPLAPAGTKSGNFNIDAHDKGTRIQNMPSLISHDDHDILSERLNHFAGWELYRACLGYG